MSRLSPSFPRSKPRTLKAELEQARRRPPCIGYRSLSDSLNSDDPRAQSDLSDSEDTDRKLDQLDSEAESVQTTIRNSPTRTDASRVPKMTNTTRTRPELTFSGLYSGKEPATRWLRRLNYDLQSHTDENGIVQPKTWLLSVSILLIDEAASWAESNEEMRRIFDKDEPASVDVAKAKELLQQWFPTRPAEPPGTIDIQLIKLEQETDEQLYDYYKRGLKTFTDAGGREPSAGQLLHLGKLEISMLRTVIRKWVAGLKDRDVEDRCYDELARADVSMMSIYRFAEQATEAKADRAAARLRRQQQKELEVYKTLALERVPAHQIQAKLAELNISDAFPQPKSAPMFIYQDGLV